MVIRYLLADALSLFGNAVAAVALPWLVLVRTGDAAAAGVIAAASALPMLLAAVVGGWVVDRFGRRRISVGADLASAASIAALPLVDAWTGLTLAWFVALGVAGALFDVPGMTAREALGPDVAAAAGVPLERLAGLREGLGGVVLVLGPAAAGAMLALVEPVIVLWVTAACSALAAAVTATLPAGVGATTAPRGASGIGEGWAVLRADRLLAAVTLVSVAAVAVIAPLQGIVLPVHLVAQDAPGLLGLVITAIALGGIVGAGFYAAVGARWARRPVFVGALLVATVGVVGVALLPPAPLMLAAAALVGLGSGPLSGMTAVLLGERIPERVRGRVMGLQNAAVLSVAPAGVLGAGLLADAVGVRTTGMLVAGLWLLVALGTLLTPALRALETAPTVEVGEGADDR
jgi:MFS family permease